jgi:hypothetical protein
VASQRTPNPAAGARSRSQEGLPESDSGSEMVWLIDWVFFSLNKEIAVSQALSGRLRLILLPMSVTAQTHRERQVLKK